MNERIINLLSMCLQAREKGHDVFFNYSPHVQAIGIKGYKDGYRGSKPDNPAKKFYFYIDGYLGGSQENLETINSAEEYLKGLIA